MADILIGIVVPTFNAERYIRATLESIAAQTVRDFHCCVVDDGSTDGTRDLSREFAALDDRFSVVEQQNGGVASARNRGPERLVPRTEFLTVFDHDDLWVPEALECLLAALRGNRGAVGAHGLADYVDESGVPHHAGEFAEIGRTRAVCSGRRLRCLATTEPSTFASLLLGCTIFPPGLVLTRSAAYAKVGGFDPDLVPADDWDMLIRLARLGDFVFVDRIIVGYRRHTANQGLSLKMRQAHAAVRRMACRSAANTAEQSREARRAWRAVQLTHATDRARQGREAWGQRHRRACAAEFGRVLLAGVRYAIGRPSALTFDGRRPRGSGSPGAITRFPKTK